MYFQAKAKGKDYDVVVREVRDLWHIEIREKGKNWMTYQLSKSTYKKLDNTISLLFKDQSYLIDVIGKGTNYTIYTRGSYRDVHIYNDEILLHESLKRKSIGGDKAPLTCGMPGKIIRILVKKGDRMKEGQALLVMEAMKMENELTVFQDCVVEDIFVSEGERVEAHTILISFS